MAKNNNLTDFLTDTANAIRTKKGTTGKINPQDFSSEIASIQTGTDTSDATATADDILLGKTAYAKGEKLTGTIETYAGEGGETVNKLASLADGTITEVTAEDLAGATGIKNYMFYKCDLLTSVTIPDSVTSIGDFAFQHGNSLAIVTIPNSVTSIGKSAFQYCLQLRSITIPNSVTRIGQNSFESCIALASVTISNSITSIESNAFKNCSSLTSITIPDSVIYITSGAFYGCGALTSVNIPNSVTSIGDNAFYNCHSLTSITIPNSVTRIAGYALQIGYLDNKATITMLPTTPPTIQSSTFNRTNLNKIIVPAGTGATYKAATNWSNFADYIEEAAE